jgi:hypothetical protein
LNTLISPHSAFHLSLPAFINDQGEIGVFGLLVNGDQHALLLIPCDEENAGSKDAIASRWMLPLHLKPAQPPLSWRKRPPRSRV